MEDSNSWDSNYIIHRGVPHLWPGGAAAVTAWLLLEGEEERSPGSLQAKPSQARWVWSGLVGQENNSLQKFTDIEDAHG